MCRWESWAPAGVVIGCQAQARNCRRRRGVRARCVDRQARTDQRERPDKTEPTLAAEPIDNVEASEAAENADAREPTDPTDRIEPAEPIDKMEPEDPSERDELTGTCIRTFWQQRLPARAAAT